MIEVPEGEMSPPPKKCPRCGKKNIGERPPGRRVRYYCKDCSYSFIPGSII